jgi:hypothetical protein
MTRGVEPRHTPDRLISVAMTHGGSASPHPGWLKISGIGCGALILLLVLAAATVLTVTQWSYSRAFTIRSELDARYGAPDTFRIPGAGGIPSERISRFLMVRRALLPRCQPVTDMLRPLRGVEAESRSPHPDEGTIFRNALRAARNLPRFGLVFGDYVELRNRMLLEQQMGLGEYSFIFVAGYVGLLAQTPTRLLEEPTRGDVFGDRVYREVAAAIDRFIADRGLTGGPWVAERERLMHAEQQRPFATGLPPELEASLTPFRDALSATACAAAAELDVTMTVRREWFGFDHK